jgi:hypothetical protein
MIMSNVKFVMPLEVAFENVSNIKVTGKALFTPSAVLL